MKQPLRTVCESVDFIHYKTANNEMVLPRFVSQIKNTIHQSKVLSRVYVEGLQLDCWSDTPRHLNWLKKYLHPLVSQEQSQDKLDHFKIGQFFADDLIAEMANFIASRKMDTYTIQSAKGLVTRLVFSSHLIIDFDSQQGMAWVTDLEQRTLTLITSAHTHCPTHHFARLARDVITGFLRQHGWLTFHAGAVLVENKPLLVVGDQGAGKTSWILAMLAGGANYIANDRVFIKYQNNSLHVLSAPMAIAVGLGTALQYPKLKAYIKLPTLLTYPAVRFDHQKVCNTPEQQWPNLPDKLQFFAEELATLFNTQSQAGGELSGILFPKLSHTQGLYLQEKSIQDAKEVLTNNYFAWQTDSVVPPWRPFDFGYPTDESVQSTIAAALLNLPLVDVNFWATRERSNELMSYAKVVSDYLKRSATVVAKESAD